MGYNAGGKINGLWNAQIYAEQNTEYILKSADYNSEIAPGQSVNFGYTLSGDSFKLPQNIFNCSKRIDITDNYDVYYNIVGDYGNTYQAEMIVENLSDTDYSAWQLSFDGNVTIDNLWNGKLIENNNSSFKVKNAEHNSFIYAGNSVSFNFTGTRLHDSNLEAAETSEATTVEPATENLTENIVEEAEEATETSEEAEDTVEETVDTVEETVDTVEETVETAIEITAAQTDEIDVSNIDIEKTTDVVSDATSMDYSETSIFADTDSDSDIIFKNYKLTAVVIPIEFGFEFDTELDSDEDGLPDYIEKSLGLDRYNPDTDGDGLPDGYEYYHLGTDPAKADSDNNGISDADEDFDEDGLKNLKEYNLSTNPFVKDSDYDGLSDYDEIYQYNTVPTNHDTDEDKVTDGDEIILGLDPNNPATFGYPDSEYTTEQTVEIDSSALQNINDLEDNPFTISVDITAAGVADHCLTADKSGYSYPILQNDAVLGVVPELSYSEGLTVSDVIINFNIVDSAVSDRIGVYSDDSNFDGINRFSIFKYFEEENILFPIETFYDENENRVYTNVDEVGTYCLIDMEKWINNIENTESGNYYLKDEEANDPANIVFCIDTRSIIDDEAFEEVKSSIKEIVEDAFDRYVNIKVYVYYQKFGSNFKITNNLLTDINTGENYFTDYDAAEKSLDSLEKYLIKSKFWAYDYTAATQFMLDTCDENIIALYHIISDQRVMGSADKTKKLLNALENDERVYVSTICPFSDKAIDESSYAVAFAEKTKGIVYTQADYRNYNGEQEIEDDELVQATMASFAISPFNSSDAILQDELFNSYKRYTYESLKGILGDGIEQSEFRIITSTGTTNIKLDTALKPKSYYDMIGSDPTDTDKDGLNDWDEVDINFIRTICKKNGINISRSIKTGDLPKLGEYRNYYSNLGEQKIYVEQGYKQLLNKFRKLLQYVPEADAPEEVVDEIRILPILSCPVDADGDNDGNSDYDEVKKFFTSPLIFNPLIIEKYNYNENGVLKDDGELSLLWCISDDYFINRDYLSETEVIDILANRGIKEQQAKIFYEKCFTFSHNPDILFNDNTMYYWKVNENLKEWVKANEFNLRVGINPAIILSTWKWESSYGQGNCFGSLGGTKENFEQQTTTCIARYLRFFYFYQFNLIENDEKSKLDMNISKEKFSLTPCNAAMYSRAQYNNDTMIELQKWHDTIINMEW